MKNDDKKMQNPVSMFVLFARFFAIIARRLEERLGEEGLQIMKEAVNEWGFERGKDIARRARANGRENDLMSYLENYDMERSDEKYGRIYCENIDPAIAKGYNEDLVCEHDKIMYDDQKCTFCFYMREKEEK